MTLYLSRATLRDDATVGALIPLLLDAKGGAAHHLAWSVATDGTERTRDYLWREVCGPSQLYLLSDRQLNGGPLYDIATMPLSTYAAKDRLRFSLRCSPVVRRSRPGMRSAKRDPILERLATVPPTERPAARMRMATEVLTDWLARLGETCGYRLCALKVERYRQEQIARRGAPPIQISIADVSGTLTVTDPTAFEARLREGFGTARAWGCGLMLTRRIDGDA